MSEQQYRILNPRNIPSEVHILARDDQVWYEDDFFEKPEDMADEELQRLIDAGFLETVLSDDPMDAGEEASG